MGLGRPARASRARCPIHAGGRREVPPLPLRHLFQLPRSPESAADACYFYDRVEEGGVRWVSYHYEAKAEVVHADDDTLALIEELAAIG